MLLELNRTNSKQGLWFIIKSLVINVMGKLHDFQDKLQNHVILPNTL